MTDPNAVSGTATAAHGQPCDCGASPFALWVLAGGGKSWYSRDRYLAYMRDHGHIVKAEPGQNHNLPCGWPGNA